MLRKFLIIALPLILVLIIFIYFANQNKDKGIIQEEERILWGVSGYVPVSYPNSSAVEIISYWKTLKDYAQIYGIHNNWKEVNTINSLSKNSKLPIELTLGYQTPKDWKEVDKFLLSLDEVLNKNRNIKYVGIGNEVNIVKNEYPKEFPDYLSSLSKISKHIKEKYPDVKVFTTIQYDHLVGRATLSGSKSLKTDFEILKQLSPHIDFLGITLYPFLEYKSVEDIPETYLEDMVEKINMPFAITETSWPTQSKLLGLNKKGYMFNEEQQKKYFEWLINKFENRKDIYFINIVYLNDIKDFNINSKTGTLFDSLGIFTNKGKEKQAVKVWKGLLDRF